jgi:cytochrome c oxidase subunit II
MIARIYTLLGSLIFGVLAHAAPSTFMPPEGSKVAEKVDVLYKFLVACSVISCILVIGGMVVFAYKYRRKPGVKSAYITHNTTAEFLWSFIPFCIFMVAFGWGWYVYHFLRVSPENTFEVNVRAQKWNWTFMYKSGKSSTGDLYVPIHTPIKLIMNSTDVIHSMYIPAFRTKQDVVPGRYTTVWFDAEHVGNYQIFCAEYCGDGHSAMMAKVHVLSKEDFDKWLQNDPYKGLALADVGKTVFNQRCTVCHNPTTEKKVGPGLKGVFGSMVQLEDHEPVLADENYVRESILYPAAKIVKGFPNAMTPFLGQLSEQELLGLIEFVKSLK